MTNAIGKGTCNFPLNMPVEERSAWGKLAFAANAKSAAAYIKELALEALRARNKIAAEHIALIRKQRLSVVMACIGVPLIIFVTFSHSLDLRRPSRARVARVQTTRRSEVA